MTNPTAAGSAQPVVVSTDAPQAGPALPIAVVADGRPTLAGPALAVVEAPAGWPVVAGPALPVAVAAIGSRPVVGGRPIYVRTVSGSLGPSTQTGILTQASDFLVTEVGDYLIQE